MEVYIKFELTEERFVRIWMSLADADWSTLYSGHYLGFLGLRLQLTQQLNITESQSERASDSLGTKSPTMELTTAV